MNPFPCVKNSTVRRTGGSRCSVIPLNVVFNLELINTIEIEIANHNIRDSSDQLRRARP